MQRFLYPPTKPEMISPSRIGAGMPGWSQACHPKLPALGLPWDPMDAPATPGKPHPGLHAQLPGR